MRKLAEPFSATGLIGRPIPQPVLDREHQAHDDAPPIVVSKGAPVTADDKPGPNKGIRYVGSFHADFFNRVYAIPARLSLIDPDNDEPNVFYLWNATFNDVTVTGIDADDDLGVELDFSTGLDIEAMAVSTQAVIVRPAAPSEQDTTFLFSFDLAGSTRFIVSLLRTNLLDIPPERPILETLKWKTDVLTSRDGTEQRFSVMQFCRQELKLEMIFESEEERNNIYAQFFANGAGQFTVPLWQHPGKISAPALKDATSIVIDRTKYEVEQGDQLLFYDRNNNYEIIKVGGIAADGITVSLLAALKFDHSVNDLFYRVTSVLLPEKPSIKRKAFGDVRSDITVRSTEFRDLFTGDAVMEEISETQVLYDKVTSSKVYTLHGAPILHARPLVDEDVEETFDFNVEVIDFQTGPFTYMTARDSAKVNYPRKFLIRTMYQEFFWKRVLKHCHGQRQPVWLPTWMPDLDEEITLIAGDVVTIPNERYFQRFKDDTSHRGLWIRHGAGWLARQIASAVKDGTGNTLLTLSAPVPVDYPQEGPHKVGFLLLSRLGSDEVQFERFPLYSFMTTQFVTTPSTSLSA